MYCMNLKKNFLDEEDSSSFFQNYKTLTTILNFSVVNDRTTYFYGNTLNLEN